MQGRGHTDYVVFVHRFAERRHDRRDGLRLLALVDAPRRRVQRRRHRGPAPPRAGAGARHQERGAGQGRRHAGRGLSRPRRRPARAERPHPARRRRSHRGGAVVLRPAQLHHHHRHRQARRDHPAAERLCRGRHHRDPRGGRRRAEADRRRHARASSAPTIRPRPAARALAAEADPARAACATERAAPGRGAADHLGLCRPACRRGVLRQHRQRRPARLHGRRPGGQRDQPHRLDVPLGRPAGADLVGLSPTRCRTPSAPTWSRSAASRCAASARPRNSSRSIRRSCSHCRSIPLVPCRTIETRHADGARAARKNFANRLAPLVWQQPTILP